MPSYAQIDREEMQFVQDAAAEAFSRTLQLAGLDADPISYNVVAVDGLILPDGKTISSYPGIFYLPVEDEDSIDVQRLVLAVKTAIDFQRWMQRQVPLFGELSVDDDGRPLHVDYYK